MSDINFTQARLVFREFFISLGIGTYRARHAYPGIPLGYPALLILGMLYENPTLHLEALAKSLRINKSSASRKLKTLEKRGYLTRKRVPGTSTKLTYTVTSKGQKTMEETYERGVLFDREIHKLMGDQKFNAFIELMTLATDAIKRITREHPDLY